MKSKRHQKILQLVREYPIDTQEELLNILGKNGFHVTQATVSRDIKELGLIKKLGSDGNYRYMIHNSTSNDDMSFKFHSIFCESVHSINYACNLVVIKCYTGMANAACAALDSIHWNGLLGTIAGDDTILAVMKTEQEAEQFVDHLSKLSNLK